MNLGITDEEADIIRYLVRQEFRRNARKRISLARKFGDEADTSKHDTIDGLLSAVYMKLGKDPDNVTNVQSS